MKLRNTLKNMFLNDLKADLLGITEKLVNLDFNSLGFDEVQTEELETLSSEMTDWAEILMTYKGGLNVENKRNRIL